MFLINILKYIKIFIFMQIRVRDNEQSIIRSNEQLSVNRSCKIIPIMFQEIFGT